MTKQAYAVQVFEAPWGEDRRNDLSVRAAFELLHQVHKKHGAVSRRPRHRPFFSYDNFNGAESLAAALAKKQKGAAGLDRIAYFACHGLQKSLCGYTGVSRTQLKNMLKNRAVFKGLYFGSCEFANKETAQVLLDGDKYVKWVAGYGRSVPWIESSVADMMFFQLLVEGLYWGKAKKSGRRMIGSPREAALALYQVFPLAAEMKFSLFDRKPGPGGCVRSTLEEWSDD